MGDEEVEILAIKPNLTIEEAIERAGVDQETDPKSIRVIGYPKFLFTYETSLSRVLMGDRKTELTVTVDGISGGRLRSDVYPDLEERTLSKTALLNPRFNRDEAAEKARSVIRRYISFHFPSSVLVSSVPDMKVVEEDFVFGLYWIVPTDTDSEPITASILDTISGEVIEKDIHLEDFTPERFAT